MRDSDAPANKNAELGKAVTVKRSADVNNGPMQAFKRAVSLFFTKDMALLSVAFFYMGNLTKNSLVNVVVGGDL